MSFSTMHDVVPVDPTHLSEKTVTLATLGCVAEVTCTDPRALQLLLAGYGHMALATSAAVPVLRYRVDRDTSMPSWRLHREGGKEFVADSESDLLFVFDKDLTIELQQRRPDLLFLHAAAVEHSGQVVLLVAPSGTGKSTLTWALLHAGFRYLSDELGPVDLASMRVSPYPHALCLKAEPPDPFRLPSGALRLGDTLHVPVDLLPSAALGVPAPLAAIVFIQRQGDGGPAAARRLGPGEAAARLYANALNPLAHGGDGLDPVVAIARAIPCYQLDSTDLSAAGREIAGLVAERRQLGRSR